VIFIVILGVSVAVAVAVRMMPPGKGPTLYLTIALTPLLLTAVLPVPFALASGSPGDWARQIALAVSRVGIGLSFTLFAIGAVLTLRATVAGDRRAALLLACETVLAAFPAGVITADAALAFLL
jgi:hypothetical protein